MKISSSRGQVLIGAVILMTVVILLVPILVQYGQNESKWSTKVHKTTAAFQLAELAVERGYQTLILTTSTWVAASSGTAVTGFNFDTTYSDPSGGEYQIKFSTGAGTGVYITGVGRDKDRREIRGIRAMYQGTANLTNSIYAEHNASVNGSADVHWAPIVSHTQIDAGGRPHPRFYCTGAINLDANGPTPPNTDNIQWWSWQTNLPNLPALDLNYYKGLAQAAGATSAACGGSFYKVGNIDLKGCNGGGAGVTGTWYATGNIQFQAGAGGNILNGTLIALGNIDVQGNGGAVRNMNVPVPPLAWKEYGNNWAYYKATFDAAAPATYAAAVAGNYTASTNKTINNIIVNGLLYAGGNFQATGAGNSAYYGVAMCLGNADTGSNVTFYFNPNVTSSARYAQNVIQRVSWRDVKCAWSSSGSAVCP